VDCGGVAEMPHSRGEVGGGAGARTLAPSEVKFLIGCATGSQIIYIAC
jgi:hypothetical protein